MAKAKGAKKAASKTTKKTAKRVAPKKAAARKPAPPDPRTVTPYLSVGNAAEAIDWYKKVFGAKETAREIVGGKVMHGALQLGSSTFFLSDIFPGSDSRDPRDTGPSVNLHLWHKDADKLWTNAISNGAKVTMPIDDMFWGDRYGRLIDPFGHSWSLATRSKLSKPELERRRVEAMKGFGSG
jgi:uncharacterized glyoxalase superfamily protein PhnB